MARSYLIADSSSPRSYSQKTGVPSVHLRPWALLVADGQVIYRDLMGLSASLKATMVAYDRDRNLERRALAETALACIVLHNPHLVAPALYKVSAGITAYWQQRREQLGKLPAPPRPEPRGGYHSGRPFASTPVPDTDPVARLALKTTATYTHGATSFGRLDTAFPQLLEVGTRQELAALYGNSIPQTINVHDNFLRIFAMLGPADLPPGHALRGQWLPSHRATPQTQDLVTRLHACWGEHSASWQRLKDIERELRPAYLFNERDPTLRGRATGNNKPVPAANSQPGLLPTVMPPYLEARWQRLRAEWFEGRTLPVEKEARIRGMERYEAAEGSEFIKEVRKHNLIFAAGQSGTTSTLFQAAKFFGQLAGEDLKTYLMAAVGYLVGGGMHSCHEMFKTATLVGIPYDAGGYDKAVPEHIRKHRLYQQWKEEFADITGDNKFQPG